MRDALSHAGVQAVLQAVSGAILVLAGLISLVPADGGGLRTIAGLIIVIGGIATLVSGVRTYRSAEPTSEDREEHVA